MSLTSVRAINVFPVALLLLQPVFGQQIGRSPQPAAPVTQPAAGTASPPPSAAPTTAPATVPPPVWTPANTAEPPHPTAPFDPEEPREAVYISGRVISDDGRPLTDRATIESVCDGVTHTEGYTDGKGDFGFRLGDRNSGIMQDASVSAIDDYFDPPADLFAPACRFPNTVDPSKPSVQIWTNCVLRARLPGYRSEAINVSNRRALDGPDVGTIVLHKVVPVDGLVSASSLAAPKNARAAFKKGQEALKQNKPDDARKDFEIAAQIYPGYATAWYELGRLATNRGDLDDALRSFQTAIQADPKYVDSYLSAAAIQSVKKQWPQLAETTGALLRLDSYNYPQAYYMNALANANLLNADAAEKSARAAAKLDTQGRYPLSRRLLAGILANRREFPEAAEQLREYLKFAPQAPDAGAVREQLSRLEALSVAAVKMPLR